MVILAGDFVWSLTLTDIKSTWTENRATWNKGSHGVRNQIEDVEKSLPFHILGFDCDNGSEFLNYHLMRYFARRDKPVQFTRSRPYRKNDNAHVEQKNWTHVLHLFGYDRFEKPCLVDLMNDIYKNEWSLYQNHFCPIMKLIEKKKINSRYYKRYDTPITPYQRLMESEYISQEMKNTLEKQHATLNPFELKRVIEPLSKLAEESEVRGGTARGEPECACQYMRIQAPTKQFTSVEFGKKSNGKFHVILKPYLRAIAVCKPASVSER